MMRVSSKPTAAYLSILSVKPSCRVPVTRSEWGCEARPDIDCICNKMLRDSYYCRIVRRKEECVATIAEIADHLSRRASDELRRRSTLALDPQCRHPHLCHRRQSGLSEPCPGDGLRRRKGLLAKAGRRSSQGSCYGVCSQFRARGRDTSSVRVGSAERHFALARRSTDDGNF